METKRVVINTTKIGAIEYSYFSAIAGIISLAILDAAGWSLDTVFTVVASALKTAASV